MSAGVWVAIAALAIALLVGAWRARSDGRFRPFLSRSSRASASEPVSRPPSILTDTPWADALGERATLLQFSSAFCAPCRATRAVLADVAGTHPGVSHVEVDAEQHLDVVRRLGILRTPTTLVLDPDGAELGRATGAPSREQVLRSLPREMST